MVLLLGFAVIQPRDENLSTTKSSARAGTRQPMKETLLFDNISHHNDDAELSHQEHIHGDDHTNGCLSPPWWNPIGPFTLLYCHKDRSMYATVLLLGWMGGKGFRFLVNPFIKLEYGGGPFLAGSTLLGDRLLVSLSYCISIYPHPTNNFLSLAAHLQ